jgi:hypothetical protein
MILNARDLSVSRGMRSRGGFKIAFREAGHLLSIRRSGFAKYNACINPSPLAQRFEGRFQTYFFIR